MSVFTKLTAAALKKNEQALNTGIIREKPAAVHYGRLPVFLRPSTETGRIILLYTPFAMRRYAAKALSFHGLLSGFYALLQSGLFPSRVNYS